MADTPKRRLLRKSALQASPFGAPIKSFHNLTPPTAAAAATTPPPPTGMQQQLQQQAIDSLSPSFSYSSSDSFPQSVAEAAVADMPTSPQNSPTSRKSARLSALHQKDVLDSNRNNTNSHTSSGGRMSTPRKLVAPTTPRAKTILKTGVWGHIVGLKKQDESVYYRYPIDKSYCSFGRSDSNDIRVQIDAVSELHCKLIRRDDGEVWLKDTSINGTLLNNVLVHDTARPIQHYDVLTIAGRKFRFESTAPVPCSPFQSASCNTPSRQVSSIHATLRQDIQTLAEAPSPTAERTLSTPKKNMDRSTAALESSLGLFTPNRAAKLSSLLVSPKPVPLPAFLAKSPKRINTPRKVLTMIDEPSILNPTCTAVQEPAFGSELGVQTPSRDKRKVPVDFEEGAAERTPKKVSFGPALSPEIFDKTEPPSTPVKRGQQQGPETPRRQGLSTPSLLSKLSALRPSARPILTPSRLGGRTTIMHDLQKPAPFNLFAPDHLPDELENAAIPALTPSRPARQGILAELQRFAPPNLLEPEMKAVASDTIVESTPSLGAQDDQGDAESRIASATQADEYNKVAEVKQVGEDNGASSDNSENSCSDDGLWTKLVPVPVEQDACSSEPVKVDGGVREHSPCLEDFLDDDDEESLPSTPTRGVMGRVSTQVLSTPTRPRHLSMDIFQQEHAHHAVKLKSSPMASDNEDLLMDHISDRNNRTPSPSIVRNNPLFFEDASPSGQSTVSSEIKLEFFPLSYSTPSRHDADRKDTTPVHTPVLPPAFSDPQKHEGTPHQAVQGSASRLALLQLSAQKIQGLPDLLLSPGMRVLSRENSSESLPTTPTRSTVTLPLFDPFDDDEPEAAVRGYVEEAEPVAQGGNATAGTDDSKESNSTLPSAKSLGESSNTASGMDLKRRASAPTPVDRSQSPMFSGLRGVFRTPQKVVESCFAGLAGFRNFVMTPTKSPSTQPPWHVPTAAEQVQVPLRNDDSEDELSSMGSDKARGSARDQQEEEAADETLEELDSSGRLKSEAESVLAKSILQDDAEAAMDFLRTPKKSEAREPTGAESPSQRATSHREAMAILLGSSRGPSPKSKEFSFAKEPSVLSQARSLDQIKARGRRSDIFPQKRTIAVRGHSQTEQDRTGAETVVMGDKETAEDPDGVIRRRRRTISLFEFKEERSTSTAFSESISAIESKKGSTELVLQSTNEILGGGEGGETEDAEQAELLRLLGVGGEVVNDEDESGQEEEDENEVHESEDLEEDKENIDYEAMEDSNVDALLYDHGTSAAEEKDHSNKVLPRRVSSTFSNSNSSKSRENTPTKRRQSFNRKRLGSSSPAFRLYEQQGEDEEGDENEDDMVAMLSPKRVRMRSFGDC